MYFVCGWLRIILSLHTYTAVMVTSRGTHEIYNYKPGMRKRGLLVVRSCDDDINQL